MAEIGNSMALHILESPFIGEMCHFRPFPVFILIFYFNYPLNIGKAIGMVELHQKNRMFLLNKVVSQRVFPALHYIPLLHKLWKIPAKNFM